MKVVWVVLTSDSIDEAAVLGVFTDETRARELKEAAGYQGWVQQAVLTEGPPPK